MSGDTAQFSQQVPLDQSSNENENESAPARVAGSSDASGQVAGTVVLPSDTGAVSIVVDGLVFEIDAATSTATLVGSAATPPKGDLSVPASVTSGTTTYEVAAITKNAFTKCAELTSISLPATLREVDPDALMGCTSLKSITVSAKNETFVSHDGMLFTKDYSRLLLIPEGMEGAANIPGSTIYVPAQAFSLCHPGSSLTTGDGSTAFASLNGMLFSKDMKTLVVCPQVVGRAVVLPAETEVIGEYALAGCKDLASITALGNVREIDPTAFADEVKASAVVALPAGESKAVWEAAGFQHFAELAEPGATSRPGAEAEAASGFVFTLLDDYTLSVTWEGAEDPAAEVEIPVSAEIKGVSYRVSTVAANAFANRGSLTSMKMPASVTSIGEAAFAGCANLTSVSLPDTLREIGERAFEATSLTNVWLPASVQAIGQRAFASCESLTRIVALGTPQVTDDALASCVNLSIYCPYNADNTYPWNLGLLANNNHVLPYGLAYSEEPLTFEVGQQANLFDSGLAEAPNPLELSFSYAAKPLSVAPDGTVTAKAPGTSEVTATLTLNNQELARATRTVEVSATSAPPVAEEQPTSSTTSEQEEPANNEAPVIDLLAPLNDEPSTISITQTLATSTTFEALAPSGQMLRYTVLATEGTPSVSVAAANTEIAGDLVIPAMVEHEGITYEVTEVAYVGFKSCLALTSISFEPNSKVKTIQVSAFNSCQMVQSLELPKSLETIGTNAFMSLYSLKSVVIPDSVTTLGAAAFMKCTLLENVVVGSGITELSDNVFAHTLALEEMRIQGSIPESSLHPNAFGGHPMENLKVFVNSQIDKTTWEKANQTNGYGIPNENIVLAQQELCTVTFEGNGGAPQSVQRLIPKGSTIPKMGMSKPGNGFAGWFLDADCTQRWDALQPVESDMKLHAKWEQDVVDGGLTYRMRPDGKSLMVFAVSPSALSGRLELPSSHRLGEENYDVVEIAPEAFVGANIELCVIPDTVNVISVRAFAGCMALKSVQFSADSMLEKIGVNSFSYTGLESLSFPESLKTVDVSAINGNTLLKLVEFAENSSLESLSLTAFSNDTSLEKVKLPVGLRSIEESVFENCSALRSLELPSSVTRIGLKAFKNAGLTAVSLPAGLSAVGAEAFANCASLSAIFAPSSFAGAGIAAAFDDAAKGNATVVLPAVSQDGKNEPFATMEEVWTKSYNFTKFSPMSGDLPTDNNTTNAHWEFTSDGTLRIWADRQGAVVQNLGWGWKAWSTGYWGPVRPFVKRVVMDANLDALDIDFWFVEMPGLLDISGVRIPVSAQSAQGTFACNSFESLPENFSLASLKKMRNMFHSCLNLKALPEGLIVPDDANDLQGMFINCSSLESIGGVRIPRSGTNVNVHGMLSMTAIASLPEDFTVPDSVTRCNALFDKCSNLVSLPDGFRLSNNITEEKGAEGIFSECTSLERLPEGFVIPDNITSTYGMFLNCSSLTSLPAGLKIPSKANLFARMFEGCTSLASLPADFDMPTFSIAPSWLAGVFAVEGPAVPLFYPGNKDSVRNYPWGEANRTLVTSASQPQGSKTVTLNFISSDDPAGGSYWTTAYTDESGLLTEPSAVLSRVGHVFTLWYADPGCTQRVDFSKAFEADTTIYGKLAPGTREGELPCQANSGSAFWTLTDEGTLYVRGGGVIQGFGWFDSPDEKTNHWAPYRSDIVSVQMCPSIRNNNFSYWFYGCTNLTDISGFVMPENVVNVGSLFQKCSSLKVVPEGFSLASNTIDTYSMFAGSAIVALPSSFKVPASVSNPAGMFYQCKDLVSLPAGFSFTNPEVKLFNVLRDCPSLTSLPDGFSFPLDRANHAADNGAAPFGCDVESGAPRVATYYQGDDSNVLNFDWASQNRTLITTDDGVADRGLYPVEYKVMNPDTNVFETSASVFTSDDGIVPDLGTLQREGYGFIGWFADEDCLKAFDFSRPVAEATTLYAKWTKHGGKGTDEGLLPTENPDGTTGQDAWWGIATDGALHIVCENGSSVAPLGFKFDEVRDKYWEPYSNDVTAVRMERNVKARDAVGWFKRMPLTDVSKGFFIPENCEDASFLLYFCSSLRVLPDGIFEGVKNLKRVGGMLQSCSNLKTLPDDFVLPTTVEVAYCLFFQTGISALPENFMLHEGLSQMKGMFYWCLNLTSLPENLKIPSTATNIQELFMNCPKLTTLPAHLLENVIKMPENGAFRQNLKQNWNVFGFNAVTSPKPDPLPTYFPATNEEIALVGNWETVQRRTIVKAGDSNRQYIASLRLPDATGAYPTVWKRLYANASNVIEIAPAAAPRAFQTFKGWYLDEECTDPATFPLKLDKDIYLYALYETTGGTLPTINPDGTEGQGATWSFDQDTHVLKIEATVPGAKIKKLFRAPVDDAHDSPRTSYWSPFRAHVLKVQMSDGILVGGDDGASGDMDYWFSGMYGLNNINGVYVPEGTVSLDHTFNMCTSLAALPGTFTLPDSLTNMTGTFRGCQFKTLPEGFKLPPYLKRAAIIFGENLELVSLPEGFALPEGVIDANYLFWNCPKLKQLPSSFLLPTNLSNASAMFGGCAALTSLPAGFTIPASTNQEKKIDLSSMFTRCTTLAALPEGFSIPDSSRVSEVTNMFRGCSALTSLPASLDLTGLQGVLGVETLFAPAADATEITTYYAGSDLAKLSVDGGDAAATEAYWKTNYKRTLVATNGGQDMPTGMCTVNFMIPDTTGNSNYTLWQSVVVAQGSTLVDPQLASRYGVAFEGWFDGEGSKVEFGTTIEPNATTMTLYARFTAPILKATAPASAKITVDASGTITKAPLRLTSQTAAPVRVAGAVAISNAEADMAVAPSALDKLHLIVKPLVGKGLLDLYLDGVLVPSRPDGFVIPTATGPANPGVLDCSIGIEDLNPTDVIFYRDGFSTGLADITFTFEIAN